MVLDDQLLFFPIFRQRNALTWGQLKPREASLPVTVGVGPVWRGGVDVSTKKIASILEFYESAS